MEEAALVEVELHWSLLPPKALESELEARALERRDAREVLLRPYIGRSDVAAADTGERLPAPPAPGRERQSSHCAGTGAADAERPAHAAGQEQQALRPGLAAQGPGPVAALPQPPGTVVGAQRQLLPGAARLAAGAA